MRRAKRRDKFDIVATILTNTKSKISITRLARKTNMNVASLINYLQKLTNLGLLQIIVEEKLISTSTGPRHALSNNPKNRKVPFYLITAQGQIFLSDYTKHYKAFRQKWRIP